jgi:argininosuccinate lyase
LNVLKSSDSDWERFGRASKSTAPEIRELETWRNNPMSFDEASYYCQILIHRAHVVMLAEEGIITQSEAAKILTGLKEVEKEAENNPSLTGYMSTETALIKKVGEIGGKMHTGRSRNDLGHTQRRMYVRDQVTRLIESVTDFREQLLEKAEKHVDTVMLGYTHQRQAQPVTLAHYLLAHVDGAGRTVTRLEDLYKRVDLNPLGAAALAGTGWPVNRQRTTDLLGFSDICENTQDCVATIDYVQEFASAIAIHMGNLSRLAEDLQIWSTDEYKIIDFDEAYAGTSSIMPQKKNPVVLENTKAYAAEAIGNLVSTITSTKGVAYTNTMDKILIPPTAVNTAVGTTKCMAGLASTLITKQERMTQLLREGYSTMTELADTLVRKHNIPFRTAHDIVVDVITKAMNENMKAEDITQETITKSTKKITGQNLPLTQEEIQTAINPTKNVETRLNGGPSPESVKNMINTRRKQITQETKRNQQRKNKIKTAYKKLEKTEQKLINII